jgi:hypothetical protein
LGLVAGLARRLRRMHFIARAKGASL